jgi:hypothetical protein
MRKITASFVGISVAVTALIAGCGKEPATTKPATSATPAASAAPAAPAPEPAKAVPSGKASEQESVAYFEAIQKDAGQSKAFCTVVSHIEAGMKKSGADADASSNAAKTAADGLKGGAAQFERHMGNMMMSGMADASQDGKKIAAATNAILKTCSK